MALVTILLLAGCGAEEGSSQAATMAPTATRPVATPTAPRSEVVVVHDPDEMVEPLPTLPLPGEKRLETAHFAFYVEDDYLPVDLDRFAKTAEAVYAAVSREMGAQTDEAVIVSFQPPDERDCPARGMTLFAEPGPRLILFADENTGQVQVLGVLAHEVAHFIHGAGFDRPLMGDGGLNEGLATWASRDYWTAWHQAESLEAMVRDYLAEGDYVPLAGADVYSVHPLTEGGGPADCLVQRDAIYSEWAAFVNYLIALDGWETFLDLMASAASEVGEGGEILPSPTDYEGVYGKTLAELEADWLAELQAGP